MISLPLIADDVEPPVDFSTTDEETILVTVRSMRNALWYYENYFIQADIVAAQQTVIEGQSAIIDEWQIAFEASLQEQAITEGRLSNWQVFGFTTGTIVALMLVLEFINAYQKISPNI